MTYDEMAHHKEDLLKQKEQAIANVNAISGAIQMVETLMNLERSKIDAERAGKPTEPASAPVAPPPGEHIVTPLGEEAKRRGVLPEELPQSKTASSKRK